jgi:hypothetical protein
MYHCLLLYKPLLIVSLFVASFSQSTIPERVAAAERKPVEFVQTVDTEPLPIATLAVEAELIVVGRLARLGSYLSEDQSDIYTDYQLTPKQVIVDRAGRLTPSTPGATPQLIVQVVGGELIVNGTTVKVTDSSLISWNEDSDLLLFLGVTADSPPKFDFYAGTAGLFQVEPGTQRVKSLLNHLERDDDLQGQTLEQIIQRIKAAQKQ